MEPEKMLWMAVFEQAIGDAKALIRKAGADPTAWSTPRFLSAVDVLKRWFRSKSTRTGGFVFLCDLLEIDPKQALTSIEERYLRHLTPVTDRPSHQTTCPVE